MKFTIEQIDMIRERAHVGYKDAKEALEKCDGDIVEALAYLEEQKKSTSSGSCCSGNGFMDMIHGIIKKGNETFLKISRKEDTILRLPMTIAVPVAIAFTPLMVTALVIAILTGCKLSFQHADGKTSDIGNPLEKADIFTEPEQQA